MRIETRTVEETQTTLQIINEPGTIPLAPVVSKLDVYFNLIEMQDFQCTESPGRRNIAMAESSLS